MASATRELNVNPNVSQVWEFISDMSNWAIKMPGYVSHEIIDTDNSVWTIDVDLGPFKRKVVIDVNVTKWSEPDSIDFKVKGKFEPFYGSGKFYSEESGTGTKIVIDFDVSPSGSMAKVIAPLVDPVLDEIADEFSKNIVNTLNNTSSVNSSLPPKKINIINILLNKIKIYLKSRFK